MPSIFRTVFDEQIRFIRKPNRSICLHNVVNKHLEFACRACFGNEQAQDPDFTCQLLTNSEELPIINYETIELTEITINKTELSKDEQYLLDFVRTI
ncbi:hypothetical protein AVEN_28232-1 [Araneus ventricosus]|uniref:Uncharacterized protein n=1 Tax=Araneus ventricosus TaxID=182803 RepID=A0A4Y2X2R6_ARAVE|nr:hypothetical protein AVEN_28232-1 [Araneus ventricosus]